ncbi:MAG: hypothetical protein ACI82Z_001711 [Cellvibrionaceae bacterium]|jgi:hypothetical protein
MLMRVVKVKKYTAVFLAGLISVASASAMAGWFDKFNEMLGEVSSSYTGGPPALSNEDITQAFKQVLTIGSEKVVSQLGQTDGFNKDAAIHISLPEKLNTTKKWLSQVGMSGTLDDLELKLNRAAEKATPQTKALFIDAINEMSFDDIRQIYSGPADSATRYFESKMTPKLTAAMKPVVSKSLAEVGAVKSYDDMILAYKSIPFVPDIKADLTEHVVKGGISGIFHYLAEQEAAIRNDPVKQTTVLLQKVFGGE